MSWILQKSELRDLHAKVADGARMTEEDALRLFPLDTRLPRVLYAEDAPRTGQRAAQRRLVIEIAFYHVDAVPR